MKKIFKSNPRILKIFIFVIMIFIMTPFHITISQASIDFATTQQIQDPCIKSVFIYNSARDNDQGKWTKNSALSWQQQSGDFPEISYLVLSNSGLDIIDASTNAPWMQIFKGSNSFLPLVDCVSVYAMNGKILIGSATGLIVLDFKNDSSLWFTTAGVFKTKTSLSDPNNVVVWHKITENKINNNYICDVSATMSSDGKELIAVATQKGVSIINPETFEIFRNIRTAEIINCVAFGGDSLYWGSDSGLYVKRDVRLISEDWSGHDFKYDNSSAPAIIGNSVSDIAVIQHGVAGSDSKNTLYVATQSGVTEIQEKDLMIAGLSKTTHWTQDVSFPDAHEVLSSNVITCLASDGASLLIGSDNGIDEIKLTNKELLYKHYNTESSPSVNDNSITSLSVNGITLVGTRNGCALLDDSWWGAQGYKYRQQIMVYNHSVDKLNAGYTLELDLNHSALVDNNRALSSGNDLRVVFYDGAKFVELDRVLTPESNWNTEHTRLLFKTQEDIAPLCADNSYYIYYGNPHPSSPLTNKSNIYALWEDFEKCEAGVAPAGWTNEAENEFCIVDSFTKRLRKSYFVNSENSVKLNDSKGLDNFELAFTARKLTDTADLQNKLGILMHFGNAEYSVVFSASGDVSVLDGKGLAIPVEVKKFSFDSSKDCSIKLKVFENMLKAYWDGDEILKAQISSGFGMLGFFNDNAQNVGGPEIDDFSIRNLIEPEPSAQLSGIEMENTPLGNIISAEQNSDGSIDVYVIVDSPYDQILQAKLEWSENSAGNFRKCLISAKREDILMCSEESEICPVVNNSNAYQIGNMPTSHGPCIIKLKCLPPSDMAIGEKLSYWIKFTTNNYASDQKVPDILNVDLSIQKGSMPVTIFEENQTITANSGEQSATAGAQENQQGKKLAFITSPQTILVNTVSNAITIQLQDMNGSPVNAEQDIILELSTTSLSCAN
jgi:hypothetical protein